MCLISYVSTPQLASPLCRLFLSKPAFVSMGQHPRPNTDEESRGDGKGEERTGREGGRSSKWEKEEIREAGLSLPLG